MRETALYQALNSAITGCQPSDHWKDHMVRQIVRGEEMHKRTKLSVSVVIAIALILISAVGLAVGLLVQEQNKKNQEYYNKVAEMERSGALDRWNLEDKTAFISAMRECGFEIDPELAETLDNAALPEKQREDAADQIINNTYGELIRNQLGYYVTYEEDSLGIAPDPIIVFEERYLAEHPEGIETHDQLRDYTDALGYYLRDVYIPDYVHVREGQVELPVIDKEYAIQCLGDYMTEILGWDPEAVAEMNPTVEWDDEYHIWTVSGEVSRESMANVTDLRKGLEPSLTGFGVEETDAGYRATVLVNSYGVMSLDTLDKKQFFEQPMDLDEIQAFATVDMREVTELAEQAIMEKYQLTEEDVSAYFCNDTQMGLDEQNNLIYRIDFTNHYAVDVERIYGVIVNLGTGTVESVFSYRTDEDGKWLLLTFAAERELEEGWYIHWSPESKKELTERIRECGLLPDHEYWRTEHPDEEQTNAFIAEVFGRKGHISTVNVMGMAEALFGPQAEWSREMISRMQYLSVKYDIRTGAIAPVSPDQPEEIGKDEAARIVRIAVCQAWGMPETALDQWEAVSQLVQTSTDQGAIALYRVFLTRPDSELGLDTFGGKDNFNYRVSLDGKILDSSVNPLWLSPAEDAERWKR